MPDIGEIKAKVTIEYDGSGIEQAKKDLASLAELADSFGQGAGSANDGLAALDEQATKAAESTQALTSSMADAQKPLEEGAGAIEEMTGALEDHQAAVEDTGKAYEEAQKPVEDLTSVLGDAAPKMQEVTKQAQAMQQAFDPGNMAVLQSFPDAIDSSIQDIQKVIGGAPTFRDMFNIPADAVLQFDKNGALIGDSVQYFADSTSNLAQGAQDATQPLVTLQDQIDAAGKAARESPMSNFVPPQATQNVKQLNDALASTGSVVDMNAAKIGNFGDMTVQANKAIDAGLASAVFYGKDSDVLKPIGMGEGFGNAMEGIMGAMNNIAMPIFAMQAIGMVVGQLGQGIYDAAAIAEGPAAHSMGTFTGTVDALGQSAQKAGEQFSESFGKAVLPTLQQLDNETSQPNGLDVGGWIGTNVSALFNLLRIGTGIDPLGGIQGFSNMLAHTFGLELPFTGPGPADQASVATQQAIAQLPQQLAVQTATLNAEANDPALLAAQAHYQSASAKAQQNQQSWDMSHYVGTSGPSTPLNNIIQAELIRSAGGQYGGYPDWNQAYFNSIPSTFDLPSGGLSGGPGLFDAGGPMDWGTPLQDILFPAIKVSSLRDMFSGGGQSFFSSLFGGGSGPRTSIADQLGINSFFGGIGDWFHNMFSGGPGPSGSSPFYDNSSPFSNEMNNANGCFPAGTCILMANGAEKPIEQVKVGDRVLAHNGTMQVTTTVQALIRPPAKQVYELTFSDGRMLTLTDSHPIATAHGWKSIEPGATARTNPDLAVTRLMWGDVVHTVDGTVQLASITPLQGEVPVYNLTVAEPHTFYAERILTHNKLSMQVANQQAADQIQTLQLPHLDLSGMASQIGGAFTSIQLPHLDLSGIASNIGGAFSGIQLPHIDLSSISASISGAFSNISLPSIPNIGGEISGMLSGMFAGIALPSIPDIGGQLSSMLSGMFSGISMPSIPDIGGMINGALSGMFGGISMPSIPDIGGMLSGALSGMFGGITLPSVPDLGAMLNGAMSGMFGGISLPPIPNIGAQISGAMSSMFSGISIPSVPFFASGVENFGGGLAVVGEAGPELISLPSGSSVYPMSAGAGVSGGVSPISLGGGGGSSAPQSINVVVQLDSQAIISAIGMPMAQNIRLASGMRGF